MAICPDACTIDLPDVYADGCGVVTRNGGISRIVFVKCNYTFVDVTDTAEWSTAIGTGDIVVSGYLLGQKPKGSFTKKRVVSCDPEAVVGAEHTITFQDYNTDTITVGGHGVLQYTFWNTILSDTTKYKLMFITCEDYVYGSIASFQLEIDEVIEDSSTGSSYFDGTLSWNETLMEVPTYVDLSGII